MTEPRVFRKGITEYSDLIGALRAWMMDELKTTGEAVDYVAGVPTRYTAKVFAPMPVKSLGPKSMGPIFGALGLEMWIVVNDEALRKVSARLTQSKVTSGTILARGKSRAIRVSPFKGSTEWGVIMRQRQLAGMSRRARKVRARIAASARWKYRDEVLNGGMDQVDLPKAKR